MSNLQVITRYSHSKLVQREHDALVDVNFNDCDFSNVPETKMKGKSALDLFNKAHDALVSSAVKTLTNDRTDAHRAGHDRCYLPLKNGYKMHLVTEKGEDGLMQPVLINGMPIVKSVKLMVLVLNKTVLVKGSYKPTNPQLLTYFKDAIKRVVASKVNVRVASLSLKEGQFDNLKIDSNVVVDAGILSLIDS